jgi:Tfp pilus assembly protein PilV
MRRTAGVTLVEVLMASVVVGAGLATILQSVSTSVRADVFAENRVKAAHLVELQLGRIESNVLPLTAGAGDFSLDGEPDFAYTIAVADFPNQPNLEQVTVDITWTEHGDPHDLAAVRLMFNDPDAATNVTGGGTASGSLMGSGSGASGSLMGSGGTGGGSGSLMGSGGGGASGSAFGGTGGGASGSSFGGGGTP